MREKANEREREYERDRVRVNLVARLVYNQKRV